MMKKYIAGFIFIIFLTLMIIGGWIATPLYYLFHSKLTWSQLFNEWAKILDDIIPDWIIPRWWGWHE